MKNHAITLAEAVGVASRVDVTRKPHHPVGKLEVQRIPTLAAPALGHAGAFEDDVLAAALR
jgi:hypothetical protein